MWPMPLLFILITCHLAIRYYISSPHKCNSPHRQRVCSPPHTQLVVLNNKHYRVPPIPTHEFALPHAQRAFLNHKHT